KPPFFLLFEGRNGTMARMILTAAELKSLVNVRHHSPHTLLGMHSLGNRSGLVVRAFLPDAATVEAVPAREQDRPKIKLKRLHESGLFEGITQKSDRVYAYDLVVTDHQARQRQGRDPYSFLPTLGETDLYLFGQGNE